MAAISDSKYLNFPQAYECPITQDIMDSCFVDDRGHTFEESAIKNWLKTRNTCNCCSDLSFFSRWAI